MKQLNAPTLVHEYREQNRVADQLAKEGLKMEIFGVPTILEVPLVCVDQALQADIVGTTFARTIKVGNVLSSSRDVAQSTNFITVSPLVARGNNA